jgi:uncharacterized repeat protein (TIGR01451 family)
MNTVFTNRLAVLLVLLMLFFSGQAFSGINSKTAVNVDPGNTKHTGQTFSYILSYDCSAVSGSCINGRVTDVLPPEVVFVSAQGTSDVASITTPAVGASGTVEFIMNSPLTAGNAGDLVIDVRFPVGTTPDGTVASNTATSTNLGGTETAGPAVVTAVADVTVTPGKTLQTNPSYLDRETEYRLRLNNSGELNVSNVTLVDTLPLGDINGNPPVFLGATPAATCEPGCVGTKLAAPYQLQWNIPAGVNAGSILDVFVRVQYDSADFSDGVTVNNTFNATGDPLGAANQDFGNGTASHPVVVFVPNATTSFDKSQGGPIPPAISTVPDNGQEYYYYFRPANTGNVDLENMEIVDTLPVQFKVTRVATGRYNSYLSDFSAGVGVQVEYERSDNLNSWVVLGSSADVSTNAVLNAPALPVGVYITRLRWRYGTAAPGMLPPSWSNRPRVYGVIVNPDNVGAAVSPGDVVDNCATLSAQYPAGTSPADQTDCTTFQISDPYVRFSPDKTDLTNSGPYVGGNTINWRLRARLDSYSSTDLSLDRLVLTDLLPVDLIYSGNYGFAPGSAGIPAPDTFEQIDNFQNTGRTLLRWTWAAGSGNFPRNTYADITYDTTVRSGAPLGSLGNTFGMQHNAPNLGQRCGGGNIADDFDLDGDGDTTDRRCIRDRAVQVQSVAQLISEKKVFGSCDMGFTDASAGVLDGAAFQYRIRVTNTGTVPMDDFTLIDILPHPGDVGVKDSATPRGSLWSPSLVSPIAAPQGVTVYYSTSDNPCRGEVGGPTTGCDAPNWSTVPPSPITNVKSFKLFFTGAPAASYDTKELVFNMVAPAGLTAGDFAYNSFAWQATRTDLGTPLGAEPNKVGTSLGTCTAATLGDYVWIDTNGDGIQNDGPTGLNNVQMFLYTPGNDGVAGTFDDVQLATTQTSMGPGGQSGWYNFPGLAAGDYYVCMDTPATYSITGTGLGGNPAQDSDINSATSCSSLVTLALDENNPDIDAGLVPTGTASLGNYVWFDYNANGIQDESPYDGVNGVTVELYIDNGNGTPDAGDTLISTLATADDVNGLPGYYRFDGLAPGVPYYVKFIAPVVATGFTSANSGSDDSLDSDADQTTGYGQITTLTAGQYDPTHDAGVLLPNGGLLLGNQVWLETDNDGVFEPQNGETGINNVRLSLYLDVNNDGIPSLNEYAGATTTFTSNGFDGRYTFGALDAGNYLVVADLGNFSGSGPLAGLQTCTGNDPAPDPDDDVNGDDNGGYIGAVLASMPLSLSVGGEPTTDGDADSNTNLTVDFCFTATNVIIPVFDYGDNPDRLAGSAMLDYQTKALDLGPSHLLGPVSPYLGNCVDADNGTNQNLTADQDDLSVNGVTYGTCATPNDDEDGVAFSSTSLLPGDPLDINVTVGSQMGCNVTGWVDWNRNGNFELAEQIVSAQPVSSATPLNIPVNVPPNQAPGAVYARFRCSTAPQPLPPTGPAPDGEVEDYRLTVLGEDWGDLPDTFHTTSAASGARHDVDPANPLMLGTCVDTETDGQPGINADGDDANVGSSTVGLCTDDEDGVVFSGGSNEIIACQINAISVTANRNALLDAWVDFDGSGTFEVAEQVFAGQALNAGVNALQISVPCGAATGNSHARFRISSMGGLTYDQAATDGEVEDYLVVINGNDLGDAATAYPVALANGGAIHGVSSTLPLYLGNCVDTEVDGQPSAGADGDDVTAGSGSVGTCVGSDDEDGVSFGYLAACMGSSLSVTANAAGVLDAWVDFDGDGSWSAAERIFNAQALVPGANNLNFTVPCNASIGDTHARFRFSSAGVSGPGGAAPDGEVEDYQVQIQSTDLGDLPDSYGTLLASNGALHVFDAASTLYLGSCVDGEQDGVPGANDDGDDLGNGSPVAGTCNGNDDEDGVTFVQPWIAGHNTDITVVASEAGLLSAWADFNADGDFADTGEVLAINSNVVSGNNILTVPVPATAVAGDIHTRFRLSSAGISSPVGVATDGEVEDHLVSLILETDLMLEKTVALTNDADGSGGYTPGDVVTFTLTLTNQGPNDATGINIQDVIPDGYNNIANISNAGVLTGGNTINWLGLSLNNGLNMSLTFDATLTGTGNYTNVAQVTAADQNDPDSTPNNDTGNQSEDDEANVTPTVDPVIDLSLLKSVSLNTDTDGSNSVTAGDIVTFTLLLANAGPDNATAVAVQDVVPNGFSGITAISNGGVLSGSNIDWAGLSLAPNTSLSLTFNAVVNATGSYTNVAQVTAANEFDIDSTPNNDTGAHSEDDEDSVSLNVGATIDLELQKTISNLSPQVGDVVTFTLTLSNTGLHTATGVSVADMVPSGYTNIINVSGTGAVSGSTVTWSGMTVVVGTPITLSFDATVAPTGDYLNIAQVTTANEFDIDSNPNNDNGDQSEDDEANVLPSVQQVIDLSLVKTVAMSIDADGSGSYTAGDTVRFDLLLSNAGPNVATNVVVRDVVPNGFSAIGNIVPAATLAGNTVTWSNLTVGVGGSITLSFEAVIEFAGDHSNTAEVVGADQGDNDSTPGNGDPTEDDEDTVTVILADVIDLSLVKTASGGPIYAAGDVVTFTLTLANAGPNNATGVVVSDPVPDGFDAISNISAGGVLAGNTVTWSGLSVAAGASLTLTFDAEVLLHGDHQNIAEVTSATEFDPDSVPGNNNPGEDDQGSVTLSLEPPQPVPALSLWMLIMLSMLLSVAGFRRFGGRHQ